MNETFPPPNYNPVPSAVSGIEVYAPAPPDESLHQEVVDFMCPQCCATTAYSVGDGGLTCSHCGYHETPPKQVVGKWANELELIGILVFILSLILSLDFVLFPPLLIVGGGGMFLARLIGLGAISPVVIVWRFNRKQD